MGKSVYTLQNNIKRAHDDCARISLKLTYYSPCFEAKITVQGPFY